MGKDHGTITVDMRDAFDDLWDLKEKYRQQNKMLVEAIKITLDEWHIHEGLPCISYGGVDRLTAALKKVEDEHGAQT